METRPLNYALCWFMYDSRLIKQQNWREKNVLTSVLLGQYHSSVKRFWRDWKNVLSPYESEADIEHFAANSWICCWSFNSLCMMEKCVI